VQKTGDLGGEFGQIGVKNGQFLAKKAEKKPNSCLPKGIFGQNMTICHMMTRTGVTAGMMLLVRKMRIPFLPARIPALALSQPLPIVGVPMATS
jgi:hypothetical protein